MLCRSQRGWEGKAWNHLGSALFEANQVEEAIDTYTRAHAPTEAAQAHTRATGLPE
ncbi:tetratricopeptide repeat protein [Streptomyces sp. NPDC003011]